MEVRSSARRVLMLARHFPPIGGAGVHRSVGYVKHLPASGYRPVVVTGPGGRVDRWSPRDPGLLAGIPADAEIHRVPGEEPAGHTGRRARADRWLQRPAPWVRWWVESAVREGLELGAGSDLILASCVPYETAEAGARLSHALGLPWIADLEDPWALDEMRVQPTALHRHVDFARMRRALASATAIVTCAPEAAARFRRAMPELAERIVDAVPIGFEPADFARSAPAPRAGTALRIVHTGSLHTELGEAHRRSRAFRRLARRQLARSGHPDPLGRLPARGARAAEAEDPAVASRIELHLAGDLTPRDRAVAERHPGVRLHGRLSHRETLALLRSADLLFLPMHELPPGQRAGIIPYKTYEYLAARRPILAAVPDGDVRDMLGPLGHATLCRPSDVAGLTRALRARVAAGPSEDVDLALDAPPLADYDRGRLVARLAEVFDDVVDPAGRRRQVLAA